jgi:hypothetical protein
MHSEKATPIENGVPDLSPLFEPLTVGNLRLRNRIVMAPLTRGRADDRVPNKLMAEYYAQVCPISSISFKPCALTTS